MCVLQGAMVNGGLEGNLQTAALAIEKRCDFLLLRYAHNFGGLFGSYGVFHLCSCGCCSCGAAPLGQDFFALGEAQAQLSLR